MMIWQPYTPSGSGTGDWRPGAPKTFQHRCQINEKPKQQHQTCCSRRVFFFSFFEVPFPLEGRVVEQAAEFRDLQWHTIPIRQAGYHGKTS